MSPRRHGFYTGDVSDTSFRKSAGGISLRTIRKKALIGTLIAATSLSLAACGSSNGNSNTSPASSAGNANNANNSGNGKKVTIELAISKSSIDSPFVDKDLLDQFEKDTNIHVNLQLLPAEQTATVLQTKLAVNQPPDIVQYNLYSATTDLNLERNFLTLDDQPWVSRISNQDVLSAYGHVYGFHISQDTGMQGVVYNKDIFKELGLSVPTTYNEFLEVCKKIKEAGYTPLYMPFKDNWSIAIWPGAAFADYVSNKDPEFWDKLNSNQKKWTDEPKFTTILDEQYQLYKSGYTNKDILSDTYDVASGKFINKEFAMMFMGDWFIQDVLKKQPDMNMGLFPIPYSDSPAKLGASPMGGQLFIPKKAEHIEAAEKFLDYIASKDVAQKIVNEQHYVSNLTDVTTPELPAYKQEIVDNYIKPHKTVTTMDGYMLVQRDQLYIDLQDEFAGGKTAEQVMSDWSGKFQQLMKDKGVAGY